MRLPMVIPLINTENNSSTAHETFATNPLRKLKSVAELNIQRQDYVAPQDFIERELVTIWSELLGIEGIGINNNFFILGGHSLLTVQLVHEIQNSFGIEISIAEIQAQPTIADLTPIIAKKEKEHKKTNRKHYKNSS